MKNFLKTSFERIVGVVFFIAFCQAPLFMQQYEAHLSGHVMELQRFVSSLQKNATSSRKSLKQYIDKFVQHDDPDFAQQGKLLTEVVERQEKMQYAYATLHSASAVSKPFLFMMHAQVEIVKETYGAFVPGLAMTLESATWGLMGLAFGSVLFHLLRRVVRLFRRPKSEAVAQEKKAP